MHSFSCPAAHSHVGLTATRVSADYVSSKGLRINMKRNLWTLAFVLTLLKTQLDFSHGRTKGDGTLEAQGQISIQINLPHHILPCVGPWNALHAILWRSSIPINDILTASPSGHDCHGNFLQTQVHPGYQTDSMVP